METRIQPAIRVINPLYRPSQDLTDTAVTPCPGATLFALAAGASNHHQGAALRCFLHRAAERVHWAPDER